MSHCLSAWFPSLPCSALHASLGPDDKHLPNLAAGCGSGVWLIMAQSVELPENSAVANGWRKATVMEHRRRECGDEGRRRDQTQGGARSSPMSNSCIHVRQCSRLFIYMGLDVRVYHLQLVVLPDERCRPCCQPLAQCCETGASSLGRCCRLISFIL